MVAPLSAPIAAGQNICGSPAVPWITPFCCCRNMVKMALPVWARARRGMKVSSSGRPMTTPPAPISRRRRYMSTVRFIVVEVDMVVSSYGSRVRKASVDTRSTIMFLMDTFMRDRRPTSLMTPASARASGFSAVSRSSGFSFSRP